MTKDPQPNRRILGMPRLTIPPAMNTMMNTTNDTTNDRQRQYEIDRITFAYKQAYTLWQRGNGPFPAVKTFVADLTCAEAAAVFEFALWLAIASESPPTPLEEPADLSLSPAGERALAAIRAEQQQQDDARATSKNADEMRLRSDG